MEEHVKLGHLQNLGIMALLKLESTTSVEILDIRIPLLADDGVWCFTTDPEKVWEFCAVPRCDSLLEVLDFSADNDNQRDAVDLFTFALLAREGRVTLGENLTICFAFMVEAWTDEAVAKIVSMMQCNDISCQDSDDEWGSITLDASSNIRSQ